jgi:outer membrane protein assembly factor BamA
MRFLACLAAAALVLTAPRAALSLGEVIRDVRVRGNARTDEDTVRSLSGVKSGETLELDTLEQVRERLNTSGLFAEVNVFWEAYRDGVRINIVVRDKFPWAPVPTFSYTSGNISAGLVIPHGNLFGRGKRGVIGGRISTADSGALIAYQDPALAGSWFFYQIAGALQDQTIPEYSNMPELWSHPVRESSLRGYGGNVRAGINWFRRVRTSVGWTLDRTTIRWVRGNEMFFPGSGDLPPPTEGGTRGMLQGELTFDFRAREHAVMWGPSLSFGVDYSSPTFGADEKLKYWKWKVNFEYGLRFLRRHNVVLRTGGYVGRRLPLWNENSVGGAGLRGYNHRQFAGDTQASGQLEYSFPLVSIMKLDVRGLVFSDAAAIYFAKLPPTDETGTVYLQRADGRQFLPPAYLTPGFDRHRDVHTSVGVGLRFFLRSVAVPLVGVDFGWGLGSPKASPLMVLVIGA